MKKQPRWEDLPVYEITFEEDGNQGICMVSLVKDPAIELKGMYFSKEQMEKEKQFQFKALPDKKIIVGYAMLPNKKILRKDKNDNPYFVVFSPETIRRMSNKFNKENSNKDINVDHSDRMVPGFIQANWITENAQYDKMRMYGFTPQLDGWALEMFIEDEHFWETAVKEEGRYSFSIEGMMGQEIIEHQMSMESNINDIIDSMSVYDLFEIYNNFNKKKKVITGNNDDNDDDEDINAIVSGKGDKSRTVIDTDEIPVHPNCRCEIDNNLWLVMPDCCDECSDLQTQFNSMEQRVTKKWLC